MENKINYSELKEVYLTSLGAFMLYTQEGYKMPKNQIQDIFSAPCWKSYYIDGRGNFLVVDNRSRKAMELKIKQF